MSRFQNIPPAKPDAIFGIAAAFNASPLKEKQLLTVGVYRDAQGRPYTFPSISKAEDRIIHKFSKEYLPMIGHAPFLNRARSLLWTDELLAEMGDRIGTVQSCAGTGGLYLISHFAKDHLHPPKVLLSDPTWPN